MKRVNASQIGIVQGSRVLFSDFRDDGPMWAGTGPREHREAVTFDPPFHDAPSVQVSMSMWDTDSQTNHRMDISAENITSAGFDLIFKTWGDSRVARVRVDWLAIGALGHDEGWDDLY
ncbi:H-type lectin domain-containing protein [Litoreibacter roseus]|uniref:H-type lectin domain-containing protein n=1 Tax=Litoreibacter roseus TaxID=2601869 RepID=A0A6N6JJ27_9RHOB|nr:H-type lectin domain-containing protein [Litoreibacter roseus]GFE65278.1 hypothetical protein KIN_23520 [Litoreibacter roseus]